MSLIERNIVLWEGGQNFTRAQNCTNISSQESSKLHEGNKLQEDKVAPRVNFAQNVIFFMKKKIL